MHFFRQDVKDVCVHNNNDCNRCCGTTTRRQKAKGNEGEKNRPGYEQMLKFFFYLRWRWLFYFFVFWPVSSEVRPEYR